MTRPTPRHPVPRGGSVPRFSAASANPHSSRGEATTCRREPDPAPSQLWRDSLPGDGVCSLVQDIKASLVAKMVHLLQHPCVVAIERPPASTRTTPSTFDLLADLDVQTGAVDFGSCPQNGMQVNADGTVVVVVQIAYGTHWGERRAEVEQRLKGCLEQPVVYLSDYHRTLLEERPIAYVELPERPETVELLEYSSRELQFALEARLKLAAPPKRSAELIRHIAIDPNLVQLERQMDALAVVVGASNEGPLAPLRGLVGIAVPCGGAAKRAVEGGPAQSLATPEEGVQAAVSASKLDEHQRRCVSHALETPDFCVIKGPPGAGKTTVISSIIEREVGAGRRVLVVSPTHVAVDNVVEKLTAAGSIDRLAPHTLPVRHAARDSKLSPAARHYWSGSGERGRSASIAARVQALLIRAEPGLEQVFATGRREPGRVSKAIAAARPLICGTPIGILSDSEVKTSSPGSFDLLIVDEVSKMTMPEFLAIAVKARRWVLVGDPDQLPPFVDAVEVACTLDELVTPVRELAATVAAQYIRPNRRPSRIVVVARDPSQAVAAIRERLDGTRGNAWITVDVATRSPDADVVVCAEGQETGSIRGVERLPRARVIVERGLAVAPSSALLKPRDSAQARFVEEACREYHIRPWRSAHGLGCRDLDGATARLLVAPSADVASGAGEDGPGLHGQVVRRLCVNSVSVYDWLVGLPALDGTQALRGVDALNRRALVARVQPRVGTLVKQYRMHPSISSVPRELFYFGGALLDGRTAASDDNRVRLRVVRGGATGEADTNAAESTHIAQSIADLAIKRGVEVLSTIMVITPYRAQEALIRQDLHRALQGICAGPGVEVSTLDRCQGREADLVFISLVRPRASSFLDHPKRWNVALTRAKESMIIVGDIEAYIEEGERALRADRLARGERNASVIALALRAYARQRPSS